MQDGLERPPPTPSASFPRPAPCKSMPAPCSLPFRRPMALDDLLFEKGFRFWTSRMRGDPELKYHEHFNTMGAYLQYFAQHRVQALPDRTCLHLFTGGIRPLWEDPHNVAGGHFKLTAKTVEGSEDMWDTLVKNFVWETFPHNDVVNGVTVMSNHRGNNLIKVWLAVTDEAKVKEIRKFLGDILHDDAYLTYRMTFTPHSLVLGGASKKLPAQLKNVGPK